MGTARDIMHIGAECIGEHETLSHAARRMRDLNVGAMPICGKDQRLRGILTDRDIVVKCLADGGDPDSTTAGELAAGPPIWVDADAATDEVIRLLAEHKVRRVPVLEERRLVGVISEADVATRLPESEIIAFTRSLYGAPPNN